MQKHTTRRQLSVFSESSDGKSVVLLKRCGVSGVAGAVLFNSTPLLLEFLSLNTLKVLLLKSIAVVWVCVLCQKLGVYVFHVKKVHGEHDKAENRNCIESWKKTRVVEPV